MKRTDTIKRIRTDEVVTLQHVADLAGVHPMTVSNALKGTGRVAQSTRDKVQRIAEELNYRPNLAARALATGRTGSIAVVTGPVSEHFYAHVLHLLEIELAASNYKMVFLRSRDLQKDLVSTVKASAVDGVIAMDAFTELRRLVQSKSAAIPPYVYAGVLDPGAVASMNVDHIEVDLTDAVQEAVRTLLASGCQRAAYLVANEGMALSYEVRARNYLHVMEEAGRTPEFIDLDIGIDTSRRDLARTRLVAYIEKHGAPDGVLCQNDEMAIAAYRALRDLGLSIPHDVQLIGCDGLKDMDYFDPAISTIVQPAEQMCALAWQFLQRRLADAQLPVQRTKLNATFKSTASVKNAMPLSPPIGY